MSYQAHCHVCKAEVDLDYPTIGIFICNSCARVIRSLVIEHQNADVMSGIVETISPEEEAAEDEQEKVDKEQELGSLSKTLKRLRSKKDET